MLPRRITALCCLFTALVVPASAQVFWSNYSPSGVTDAIWCVTYANGTFAAVTDQGNLLTSSNGLNWSSQSINAGTWLVSIAYGDGKWVVVGNNGTIMASSDLKIWTQAAAVTNNKLNGVIYARALWVAVGDAGTIVTSADAQNWILQPPVPGVTGYLHGLTLTTNVGNILGLETIPTGVWICGANGVIVEGFVGTGPSPTAGFFPYATLGSGMFPPNPPEGNLEAILTAPQPNSNESQTFVGAGQGTLFYTKVILGLGTVLHSEIEGFSTSPTVLPNVDFRGLTYGNGYYVAAGENGTIYRSNDGINWLQSYSGDSPSTLSTANLFSVAYSPLLQRFVATGANGTILVSNPPPTVLGNVSTRGYVSNSQTFIGGFVIQGTAPRTVLLRADGPTLATFNVANPLSDPVITVFDGKGNVVATNSGWTTNASPSAISTAALEVGAFAFPNPSLDSAVLLTLTPGAYTAQITSSKGNSGIALFEAYTN
jgi:hypothetical protein